MTQLATLTGTEKQIAYATDIRTGLLQTLETIRVDVDVKFVGGARASALADIDAAIEVIGSVTDSRLLIKEFSGYTPQQLDEMASQMDRKPGAYEFQQISRITRQYARRQARS